MCGGAKGRECRRHGVGYSLAMNKHCSPSILKKFPCRFPAAWKKWTESLGRFNSSTFCQITKLTKVNWFLLAKKKPWLNLPKRFEAQSCVSKTSLRCKVLKVVMFKIKTSLLTATFNKISDSFLNKSWDETGGHLMIRYQSHTVGHFKMSRLSWILYWKMHKSVETKSTVGFHFI